MTEPVVARRFFVSGVVQGVGFRAFVRRVALGVGVTGHVRNVPDGRVEAVAAGTVDQLSRLLRELERGPRFARVDAVTATEVPLEEVDVSGFHVR